MTDEPLLFTADAATLGAALRQLHRHGARTPGPAIWRLSGSELRVQWKGGAHAMDVEGDGTAAFRVDARYVAALAKTLAKSGVLEIRVSADAVRFGTFAVPKADVDDGATDLLPVDADDREVLMLAYRHGAQTIANAGLTAAVAEARGRLAETARRAARELAWVGIDETQLARWLDAHLDAVAAGKPSFRIAVEDPSKQQLRLFE